MLTANTMDAQAPTESTMTPEELATKLDQLKAFATQQYSLKNYDAAAEFYSEAAETQDQINGEMSPDNADLLYQYGRCLYHVAVSNSDVLGGKVASTEEPKRKKRKVARAEGSDAAAVNGDAGVGVIGDAMKHGDQKPAEDTMKATMGKEDGAASEAQASSKPFFQITGDENWTDSEDEDEDDADAEAEQEEDDFAIAYEILDLARVLLRRKLEAMQSGLAKGTNENGDVRQLRERLADTHDLQAEISLENERFNDAIHDTRDALALKLELYPQESSLVAEAHFKLSLALEFASVTTSSEGGDDTAEPKESQVDESLRQEAATEMEKAIASCKLRISREEASLTTTEATNVEERKKSVNDVREMVADMEQRLVDLRNPAVSLSGTAGLTDVTNNGQPLKGVLGGMQGESKVEQLRIIAEATQNAKDLSGLVKPKKKPKAAGAADDATAVNEGKGKRKAECVDDVGSSNGKKVKTTDGA